MKSFTDPVLIKEYYKRLYNDIKQEHLIEPTIYDRIRNNRNMIMTLPMEKFAEEFVIIKDDYVDVYINKGKEARALLKALDSGKYVSSTKLSRYVSQVSEKEANMLLSKGDIKDHDGFYVLANSKAYRPDRGIRI